MVNQHETNQNNDDLIYGIIFISVPTGLFSFSAISITCKKSILFQYLQIIVFILVLASHSDKQFQIIRNLSFSATYFIMDSPESINAPFVFMKLNNLCCRKGSMSKNLQHFSSACIPSLLLSLIFVLCHLLGHIMYKEALLSLQKAKAQAGLCICTVSLEPCYLLTQWQMCQESTYIGSTVLIQCCAYLFDY